MNVLLILEDVARTVIILMVLISVLAMLDIIWILIGTNVKVITQFLMIVNTMYICTYISIITYICIFNVTLSHLRSKEIGSIHIKYIYVAHLHTYLTLSTNT